MLSFSSADLYCLLFSYAVTNMSSLFMNICRLIKSVSHHVIKKNINDK